MNTLRQSSALRRLVSLAVVISLLLGTSGTAGAISHMTYHGGEVMPSTTTYAIFWLPPDRHFEANTSGDDLYRETITRFLNDVGSTPYYNVLTQYSKDDGGHPVKNGPIRNESALGGVYIDTSAYPHAGTQQDPLQRSDFQAEVSRAMVANHWIGGLDKFFVLYTAGTEICGIPLTFVGKPNEQDCTFSGQGHGTDRDFFQMDGQPVIYSFVPEAFHGTWQPLASDASPNGDPLADTAVFYTAYNLVESVTDPFATAWYAGDQHGGEVADGACYVAQKPVDFHGNRYALPALWSNAGNACVFSYTAPTTKKPKKCKKGYHRVKGKCRKQKKKH